MMFQTVEYNGNQDERGGQSRDNINTAGGFSLNTYSGSNTASLLINIEGPDQAPARLALGDNYGTLKVVSKPAADFATLVDPASKTLASTVMVSLYVPETRTPWS